jgi:hypothetical protein
MVQYAAGMQPVAAPNAKHEHKQEHPATTILGLLQIARSKQD